MTKQLETGQILKQGCYLIEANYKTGGQAFVYFAKNIKTGESLVIKQNIKDDDNHQKVIEQERDVLIKLNHPFLPKVHDLFYEFGYTFLVMSRIVGENLSFLLANTDKPFSSTLVTQWTHQLLEILIYLQQQDSRIHGDIKPQNIRLGHDGNIYLLDFGLTSQIGQKNAFVIGTTKNFSSPEQIRDENLKYASDIYSLGATVYYLLTKVLPVDAGERQKLIDLKKTDPLIPIQQINPSIPEKLANLIHDCLQLIPINRPQNASEMLIHLARCLDTEISERPEEEETLVKLRDGTRINIPIGEPPTIGDSTTVKIHSFGEDKTELLPSSPKYFDVDSTVEALQLIQFANERSYYIQEVAHIIIKVMDAPSEKRRILIDQYEGHLSKFKQSEVLIVKNFLDKLAKFSVCDTEIQQNLRLLLKDIVQRTNEDQKSNRRKEFVYSQHQNDEIKKSQWVLILCCIRGSILGLLFAIILALLLGLFGVFSQVSVNIFLALWLIISIVVLIAIIYGSLRFDIKRDLVRIYSNWKQTINVSITVGMSFYSLFTFFTLLKLIWMFWSE